MFWVVGFLWVVFPSGIPLLPSLACASLSNMICFSIYLVFGSCLWFCKILQVLQVLTAIEWNHINVFIWVLLDSLTDEIEQQNLNKTILLQQDYV